MENVNSVCYIDRIKEINKIEGADNIVLATVNGWNGIIQKDQYQVGDLVAVFTTDAVIPEVLAENMGVKNYLRNGNRVRTVKLRGVYSECILFLAEKLIRPSYLIEGFDLESTLKVYKYEPPVREISLSNGKKYKYKANSNFHIYYKFPNAKNVPNMFTEDDIVVVTRKIHGTNARHGIVKKTKLSLLDRIKKLFGNKWADYEFVYGSHNVEKGSDSQGYYSTDVWKQIANKYDIKNKLWKLVKENYLPKSELLGSGYIIYGEIYGPKIQGEKYSYGKKELELVLFDIEENGSYLSDISYKLDIHQLQLPTVEILYRGKFNQEKINSFVFNNYIEGTKIPHEGVVVKSIDGSKEKRAKYINPEYLTYGEKFNVPDSH